MTNKKKTTDVQRMQVLMQLHDKGLVSTTRLLAEAGLNFDEEWALTLRERSIRSGDCCELPENCTKPGNCPKNKTKSGKQKRK